MKRSFLLFISVLLIALPASGDKKGTESMPAWSPDGTKIAFVSDREGDPQIYVMDADGANVRRLTHTVKLADAPAWSPDGKKLAMSVCTKVVKASSRWTSRGKVISMPSDLPEWDIFVIDADGSNLMQLTHDRGDSASPAWSPNGNRIAFKSAQTGLYYIHVMNTDGSTRQQLIDGQSPAWSPDGKKVAFTKVKGTDALQIYTVDVDGSNLQQLTSGETSAGTPTWSPDGKRIAFTLGTGKTAQVSVMDADGSNRQQLIHGGKPAWSPDGKTIAFMGGDLDTHIYLMAPDGSNVRQITGLEKSK
jgi:Tol biopolymer transport system component